MFVAPIQDTTVAVVSNLSMISKYNTPKDLTTSPNSICVNQMAEIFIQQTRLLKVYTLKNSAQKEIAENKPQYYQNLQKSIGWS